MKKNEVKMKRNEILKKAGLVVVLLAVIALIVAIVIDSASNIETVREDGIMDIRERTFNRQISDIRLNPGTYIGETIRMEGLIFDFGFAGLGEIYGVGRNGPMCCGKDGFIGLFVEYDGRMPDEDEWVSVVGTIEMSDQFRGEPILRISQITVMDERGQEYVGK
ncbi:MAG: hypothetical protein FWC79_00420 [Oscillospiraceae bacterium]|nr:hypothetical protein [Oscillospiraceae bacterium]